MSGREDGQAEFLEGTADNGGNDVKGHWLTRGRGLSLENGVLIDVTFLEKKCELNSISIVLHWE